MDNSTNKKKRILFAYAHLDDETILSFGTINKLLSNDVHILILCGEAGHDKKMLRQQPERLAAFKDINSRCTLHIEHNYDTTLTNDAVDEAICRSMLQIKPDIVFTHSITDLHWEHRLVAEHMLVHCRRTEFCYVKELYMAASQTIAQTYGQFGCFQPNYFVDITSCIDEKKAALDRYSLELPQDSNDLRSTESIIAYNRQYGRLMNVGYCEVFQQIFKLR